MSIHPPISPEELLPVLHDADDPHVRSEGMCPDGASHCFELTGTGGASLLFVPYTLEDGDVDYGVAFAADLESRGIPCLGASQFRGELQRLRHRPVREWGPFPGASVFSLTAAHCFEVGQLLARIHVTGASYPDGREAPRGARWLKDIIPGVLSHLTDEQSVLIKEEVRYQSLFRFQDLPRGMLHGGLSPRHALWQERQIAGVGGFYLAHTGPWLYDVAFAAHAFCAEPGALDRELARALLEGYHSIRSLKPIERGAWPVMLRAVALSAWMQALHARFFPPPGLDWVDDPALDFETRLRQYIHEENALKRLWV